MGSKPLSGFTLALPLTWWDRILSSRLVDTTCPGPRVHAPPMNSISLLPEPWVGGRVRTDFLDLGARLRGLCQLLQPCCPRVCSRLGAQSRLQPSVSLSLHGVCSGIHCCKLCSC